MSDIVELVRAAERLNDVPWAWRPRPVFFRITERIIWPAAYVSSWGNIYTRPTMIGFEDGWTEGIHTIASTTNYDREAVAMAVAWARAAYETGWAAFMKVWSQEWPQLKEVLGIRRDLGPKEAIPVIDDEISNIVASIKWPDQSVIAQDREFVVRATCTSAKVICAMYDDRCYAWSPNPRGLIFPACQYRPARLAQAIRALLKIRSSEPKEESPYCPAGYCRLSSRPIEALDMNHPGFSELEERAALTVLMEPHLADPYSIPAPATGISGAVHIAILAVESAIIRLRSSLQDRGPLRLTAQKPLFIIRAPYRSVLWPFMAHPGGTADTMSILVPGYNPGTAWEHAGRRSLEQPAHAAVAIVHAAAGDVSEILRAIRRIERLARAISP